jgi:hypothetical protein
MSKSQSKNSRRVTPWDDKQEKTPTQEFLSKLYKEHYIARHPPLNTTGEENLINAFVPETCPYCNGACIKKNGYTRNKVQRYLCLTCGKTFTPVTGTIFENHKISVTEWLEYTLNILRYVSVNADSWNNKNAFTTSRYWLEKLFIVLQGTDSGIVLKKRVWLDETYYTVRSDDIVLNPDGTKPRGLSKNQLCIGVACDSENIVCVCEGVGQPSKQSTYAAFKDHIEPGATLVHDKGIAHNLLIEKLHLISEEYDSSELKQVPDKENPLARVNEVHARLKKFLQSHSSFDRENMRGYLDLFTFAMNPPKNPLEKVEMLLEKALRTRKTLRYRDFYSPKNQD